MQIGVNTWVWTSPLDDRRLADLVPRVARLGFDVVEIPLERADDIDPAAAARLIADHGLRCTTAAVIGPDRDLIHPDPEVRAAGAAYVRDCLDVAQVLGSPVLVGPLYSGVGRTWRTTSEERARTEQDLAGVLRPLAEHAGERGVRLGLEPLNRFETSLVNLAEQAVRIVDLVDHPACGILLDTFHMNIEERSLGDAVRLAGPRLAHFHACENDRGAPGSGHVPWDDVARALHDIGYEGAVVIESFTDTVQSIAQAAAVWRPVAESPDALAGQGGRFLRSLLAGEGRA